MGSVADIRDHMEAYASCGTKVGKVDHVEGNSIKLTKNDSPDGQHHRIPLSWVAKVHDHIHLNKDHNEVKDSGNRPDHPGTTLNLSYYEGRALISRPSPFI